MRTGQKVKWVLLYVRKTQSSVHPLVFYDIKPCIFIPKCHRYILEKILFQNVQEWPRGVINIALRTGHGQSIADRTLFHFAYKWIKMHFNKNKITLLSSVTCIQRSPWWISSGIWIGTLTPHPPTPHHHQRLFPNVMVFTSKSALTLSFPFF